MKNESRDSELAALAGASGIQVIRDELNVTILRFEFEPGQVEWVAFNPDRQNLQVDFLNTKEPFVYRDAND